MKVEMRALESIKPYEKNAKKHDQTQHSTSILNRMDIQGFICYRNRILQSILSRKKEKHISNFQVA